MLGLLWDEGAEVVVLFFRGELRRLHVEESLESEGELVLLV